MDETKVEQVDWRIQLGAPPVVLGLYVLSTGPFVWLIAHGLIPEFVGFVYWPLSLFKGSETFTSALEWYLGLWVTDSP